MNVIRCFDTRALAGGTRGHVMNIRGQLKDSNRLRANWYGPSIARLGGQNFQMLSLASNIYQNETKITYIVYRIG